MAISPFKFLKLNHVRAHTFERYQLFILSA